MTDVLLAPAVEPQRDRWGRPMITPPGGGRPVAYSRCTTYIDCLDDRYNLELWKIRQTAIGLADRPDLLLAVTAHRNDKKRLDGICNEALEAAKGSAPATTGTALHVLTQVVDRGEQLPTVSDGIAADLDAYREAMKAVKVVATEQFGVHDQRKVAGTWDRVVEYRGRRILADVKTGSIDYSMSKIAMQLAMYSRCQVYDVPTGARSPLEVDQSNGLIIHLPVGAARCDLIWVNLREGWEGVELAGEVREWRRRKVGAAPFTNPAAASAATVA
jgi:hypothetical protein